MTDHNLETQEMDAIKNEHGEVLAGVIHALSTNINAANQVNGRHKKSDTITRATTIITAALALIAIVGVFTTLGGWKREMEITQQGFGTHCEENAKEEEKVWNRLEEDRQDRIRIKEHSLEQKFVIQRIAELQTDVILEQKSQSKDIKEILDKLPDREL